ncbi:MAG: pyridoxal phosphate-dependent aminotransferase [Treponema sp.]|jgi:aminotransferase/cystathionine beta-lyase|nr:pyridoxal phosphate-dependent aminotransferase [Treponema sp.]
MKYDFTTRIDRSGTGSSKWEAMYRKKADVSPGIIPLSVADMEFSVQPEIALGLKDFLDHSIPGYAVSTPAYSQMVANWMKKRRGWEVKSEWIIQTPGVVSALFNGVAAFTEISDGVIIMPPVYYPFTMAAVENGRELAAVPLLLNGTAYTIDYAALEEKARNPRNKALLFCSPHNPVGRVWTREELLAVAEICLRNNVLVISDEIHFDLLMPGVTHTVYTTLSEEAAQNCVVCTAPSKTFNLAGLQTSNIIIPNQELREKFKAQILKSAFHNPGVLGLKACEIAYTQCGGWLDELLEVIASNYQFLKGFMEQNLPMIRVFPLEGTYLVWMDFRALGLDYKALEEFMIHDAELFLDEGAMFGAEGRGFERINIACPAAVLEEALERLLKALKRRNLV